MARILLIEDSATQAAQFVLMLESVGYEVETAETLEQGLARLKQGGIDCLLLDLNLPDSEGLGTFQTAHARSMRVPIVVLTHVDDETLASATLQQGAQDYLVKGEVSKNWLHRAIQNAITRGRAESTKAAAAKRNETPARPATVVQFETRGEVTIARIKEKQLMETQVIEELSDHLLRQINERCRKMVMSLESVEYISNGAIGVLLLLRRKLIAQQGRLCLCQLREAVAEQLATRQFHRLFEIDGNLDAAVQRLTAAGASPGDAPSTQPR